MTNFIGYIYLFLAVILGITSNGFLKTTNGFTNLVPTTMCIITIVLCIFFLAKAMMTIPVGFTYATYGGLTITAVTILCANFYTLKIDKTGLTEKTRNDGIYAPLVLVIISALLCYGLADKIYV